MSNFRDTLRALKEEGRSKRALKTKAKSLFIAEAEEDPCYKCYWYLPDNHCWKNNFELTDEEVKTHRCNHFQVDSLN